MIEVILIILASILTSIPVIWVIISFLSFPSAIMREKDRLALFGIYSTKNIFANSLLGPLYISGIYYI